MGATVTVACRVPNGVELQLVRQELWPESSTEKRAIRCGNVVRIAGPRSPEADVGRPFVTTKGVDKEFWDAWLAQNKGHPAVASGALHATTDEAAR